MKIDVDSILVKIAAKKKITKFQAEMIYKSMFEMIAETMREENADNILLPRFGKFIVPKKKLLINNPEKYNKKYNNKNN